MSPMTAPLAGTFTGTDRFRPVAVVGRGSMGVVYRVHDQETGTDVALKTLAVRDPGDLYRLKNEFRSLTGVVHRNLVELYELFVDERECFFTMEFVDGINFVEYARRGVGGVDCQRLLDALRQLVSGLAALHGNGKLHRDVKPSNVLVTRDGRVVILDFGLATVFSGPRAGDTQPGLVGTLMYMAPEQAWGAEPNPAADWYSVGVMLYEALTGRVPFAGPAARMLVDKGRVRPPAPRTLVPDLPENLDALTMALLDPEPTRRPGADELLSQLQARAGAAAPPQRMPRVGRDAADVPFIGRTEELAGLGRAFAAVLSRQPSVVLVEGPSGIGKSELVRRFLGSIEGDGRAVVLDGRCHPYEAVPYKALDSLVDRLSRYLMTLPEFSAGALVPRHAGAVTRLFPVLARVPALASWQERDEAAEPYEVRRRGFAALRELLTRIGDRQPLVLWIDDLQWGDTDSAVLLRELLSPPDPPAMLLILSYRSEDRESGPLAETLKSCVGDLPGEAVHRIVLAPLSATETQDLAAQLCQTPAQGRIAAIAAEANGSPFLVTQLARHAAMRPATEDDGTQPPALHLQTLLAERIGHLGASAQELLELVSIAGRPLDRSVALDAAGIGESGRPFVNRLENEGLLRTAPHDGQPTVEIYHDRIREVIVAQVPQQRLRTRHRQLAETLERQTSPDPDALYRHYLGADEREHAGEWAVRAADRAAETLAFVEAAELYGKALELRDWDTQQTAQLETRRADALVNSGRGSEAAPLFLDAARHSADSAALDLRRRAAEQFLVSGHMLDGIAVVRQLMSHLGVRYPKSSAGAAVGTVARLVPLWLGGAMRHRAKPSTLTAAGTRRIDTCYSAAKGLVLVDPIRGLYFAVLTLAMALRCGDSVRAARSLAAVGAAMIPAGGPLARWARNMLIRAREIAEVTQDPYLLGFTAIAGAQVPMVEARWKEMLTLCDTGTDLLQTRCRGVSWEIAIGRMAALRALEELGDLQEWGRRAEQLLRESEEMGDKYGIVSGLLPTGLYLLAKGNFTDARSFAARVVTTWTPSGFDMQHFYLLRLHAYCDIGEGRPHDAWARIEADWSAVRRSGMLRHALVRGDAHLLRARAALSVARLRTGERDALLDGAAEDVRILEGQNRPDTCAHALAIRAGIAAMRGNPAGAISSLHEAAARFEAAGMELCVALARLRAAELIGGTEGRELTAKASAFFSREQTACAAALLAMYAPGFA